MLFALVCFPRHLSPMCASINSNLYAFLVEKMRTQSTYSRVNLVPSEKYLCSLSRLVFQTAYQLGNTDLPRPPLVSVLKKKIFEEVCWSMAKVIVCVKETTIEGFQRQRQLF